MKFFEISPPLFKEKFRDCMNYTALCAEDGKLILLLHPLANLVTSISTLQMENFALAYFLCLFTEYFW